MSLINKRYLSQSRKVISCVLLLTWLFGSSQSIQDKVIGFYAGKKTLCYSFEEIRYFPKRAEALNSRGTVACYKTGDSVYYRGMHTYDRLEKLKFEVVKNQAYFGVNNHKKNYFTDYAPLPAKLRYYSFKNSPKDILRPDTFLYASLYDPKYHTAITETGTSYRLELTDTARHDYIPEGYTSKRVKVYQVSKADHSILKYSFHVFWTSGEIDYADSVTFTYSYRNCQEQEVKNYVDGFRPLTGKKYVPPTPPKDSITFFPEFRLPDTSGTAREITSRYVLVDFWYKACAPCMANLKFLDKLNYKHVEIVAINVKDPVDSDIRQIASRHNYSLLFNGQELAKQLNITAFPTMYIYDKDRKVLYKHVGYGKNEELIELLDKLSSNVQ